MAGTDQAAAPGQRIALVVQDHDGPAGIRKVPDDAALAQGDDAQSLNDRVNRISEQIATSPGWEQINAKLDRISESMPSLPELERLRAQLAGIDVSELNVLGALATVLDGATTTANGDVLVTDGAGFTGDSTVVLVRGAAAVTLFGSPNGAAGSAKWPSEPDVLNPSLPCHVRVATQCLFEHSHCVDIRTGSDRITVHERHQQWSEDIHLDISN